MPLYDLYGLFFQHRGKEKQSGTEIFLLFTFMPFMVPKDFSTQRHQGTEAPRLILYALKYLLVLLSIVEGWFIFSTQKKRETEAHGDFSFICFYTF